MSFFSFLSHEKEKKVLVFDISSGTVGGAIVVFGENSLPKVIKSKREIIPFNINVYGKKLQSSTVVALKRLCKDLSYHSGKISEVHLVLSSPWVNSETKILSTKSPKSFLVTKSFIDALVDEEEKSFEKKFVTDQNKPELKKDIIQIEKSMTDIRLNGYSVENPINNKANIIEVPIFSSIALKSVIKEFQKTIRDTFLVSNFSVHSMSIVSFLFLRDIFEHNTDFSFINVHGEVTEILAVSKNHLSGLSVIP
ncbi:MAG: hypothetical protein Q7R78_00305, partial [bacterium]|nr:hypothetical protein [bacterium]